MTFVRAVVDLDFYRDAIIHPVWRVVGYVVVLMLAVSGLHIGMTWGHVRDTWVSLDEAVDNLPPFALEGGRLQVHGDQPFTLVETPDFAVVVDTGGRTSQAVLGSYPEGMWIGEREIVIKSQAAYVSLGLSDLGDVSLDNSRLRSLMQWLPAVAITWSFAVFTVGAVTLKLAGTLVLALIGLVPNGVLKRGLPFSGVWRVSAYAVTAPTVLMAAARASSITIPVAFVVYWAVAVTYVWTALGRLTPVPVE